ncbi:class I SAM-dependent methyltransferase [Gillisia sp. JM1]|uniref:class I SAM-dependent methyltransferase n=1 Tax=Gillisia sp. JM1 TaxID=1283286 RepID=UPI00041EEAB8|nr:class I SAM-dependent methyltransferase [Gillisia sp. JM1]
MHSIKSPLNPETEAFLYSSFETDKIIRLYNDINIKVDRFFDEPEIYLYKCKYTGYLFYFPYNIVADAAFYENISKNRPYYSQRWEHFRAIKYIKNNDRVLEIGSGFGIFLSMLREKNISAKGIELNSHAVNQCKIQNLNIEDCLIQEEAEKNKNKYDVVVTFQVLEHITEVRSFIQAAVDTIKPGGKLIVGVPNNNPYLFISDKYHTLNLPPHHAGLWNKRSLKSLEKIFPIKCETIEFEPLNNSYEYFIQYHLKNAPNKILKKTISFLYTVAPNILRKICCKLIKGRNIMVIFSKI